MAATTTALGHWGWDIRLGAIRVVCDPWLSARGAHLGAWYAFPDNAHLRAEDLRDAAALIVSSPRADHFDEETVRAFPTTTRVVLPRFPSRILAERVRALGFTDVVELGDGERLELGGGVTLEVRLGAPAYALTATLVLEGEGRVIVDQNECVLGDEALAALAARKPDLHLLALAGCAHAAPDYRPAPDGDRERAGEAVVARFLAQAGGVNARHVVPCGGPPVFLPGDGVFLDDDDLLARVAAVATDVAARVRVLDPGGAARADGEAWTFDQPRPAADRRAARGTLRLARAPEREARLAALRAEAPPLDAKDLRSYARDLFQYEDMTWDMKVLVELRATGGPSVWVDFRKRPVRHLTEMAEPADFVVSADAAFVSLVLKGALTWHELLAAGELAVDRPAGRDATALLNHFVYRHDPAAFDLVRWENPALMTTSDDSFEYKCQRFCPHRGRDLEYGILERGKLTCTAHNWRFDLRNGGKCLWGGDRPLLVKEVRPLTRG